MSRQATRVPLRQRRTPADSIPIAPSQLSCYSRIDLPSGKNLIITMNTSSLTTFSLWRNSGEKRERVNQFILDDVALWGFHNG